MPCWACQPEEAMDGAMHYYNCYADLEKQLREYIAGL